MEKQLYFAHYGCWQQHEDLIIKAKSLEEAEGWAYQQAVELWESWNREEFDTYEEEVDARESEISYGAEPYNPHNADHIVAYDEDGVFEI